MGVKKFNSIFAIIKPIIYVKFGVLQLSCNTSVVGHLHSVQKLLGLNLVRSKFSFTKKYLLRLSHLFIFTAVALFITCF